jgi:hypothetical protein
MDASASTAVNLDREYHSLVDESLRDALQPSAIERIRDNDWYSPFGRQDELPHLLSGSHRRRFFVDMGGVHAHAHEWAQL